MEDNCLAVTCRIEACTHVSVKSSTHPLNFFGFAFRSSVEIEWHTRSDCGNRAEKTKKVFWSLWPRKI
jgi:hypothetical protein